MPRYKITWSVSMAISEKSSLTLFVQTYMAGITISIATIWYPTLVSQEILSIYFDLLFTLNLAFFWLLANI